MTEKKQKEKYESPEIEISLFELCDILTTSSVSEKESPWGSGDYDDDGWV